MKKQVYNPYLPSWEYIPDGEPRVFGDRLYIYGSHDRFGGNGFCLNDYVCWSAPEDDLSDWRYEGVIYPTTAHPSETGSSIYYAPDVIKGLDGKYYLYYSVMNSSITSVAVCDTPAGRYEYLGDVKAMDGHVFGTKPEDWFQFDPSIFIDDDERIWLYSGSGQPSNGRYGHKIMGCYVTELDKDMITAISEPKVVLPADWDMKKPNFFEGTSARKINGKYYLVYPTSDMTGLNYATSDRPDEGFVWQGRVHSTSDIGYEGRTMMQARYPMGNNHGGLVCVKGQWYVFDHRQTNNSWFCRQGVAEPVTIEADGSIKQVEATSCGLNGGPLRGIGEYPAYIVCNLMKKSLIPNPMGGAYVTQDGEDYVPEKGGAEPVAYVTAIKKNSMLGFKYFDFDNYKPTEISVKVRGKVKGKITVHTQEKGGSICSIPVKASGSEWVSFSAPLGELSGTQALYFTYSGSGSLDMLSFELK